MNGNLNPDDFISKKIAENLKNQYKNNLKFQTLGSPKEEFQISDNQIIETPIFDLKSEYRISKILGEGSFSVVRKLIRKSDGKEFALKQFKSGKEWPTARGEASILMSLDHPNIIKFHRFYEKENKVN